MMTCEQLIEFLADYQSGELPQDKREVFEQHLKLCPPCVKYLDTYRECVELAKDACKCNEPSQPRMPEALVQAILKACNEPDCGQSGEQSGDKSGK